MPEVSVIIPMYNASRFIVEALQSVFDQTFKDWEIIVVDDGSTDDSRQIIEKYRERLKYFWQENGGPSKARNYGIRESSGEYIAFLDADDVWFPSKLGKQINAFRRNAALGMVLTDNSLFDEHGIYRTSVGKRNYLMRGNIIKNIFIRTGVVTSTVMVRKDVFNTIGLFEEELRIAEDDNMWIRIAAHYDIELIDEPLLKFRDHRFRTMRTSDNIEECVLENIQLLTSKYGDRVKAGVEPFVPRKLSEIHFIHGYGRFEKLDFKEARRFFVKALSYYKRNWKCYIYLTMSLFPVSVTRVLQSLKRRLLSSSFNGPKWTR